MSRIQDWTPEVMNEEQRNVAEEIISGPHGHLVGPYLAWLETPDLARRVRGVSEYIRFKASLPKRLSELAILVTGRQWKAEFEYYAHAKLARKAGVDDAVIEAIAAGETPRFAQEDEAVVYGMCTELFQTRRLSDATFEGAVRALGRQAVVEVVATIGYYSMVSLTLNAFNVPLPKGEASPFPD